VSNNRNTDLRSGLFECAGEVIPCDVSQSPAHVSREERFLMLALLADAINIFLNGKAERRLLAETRTWIQGGNTDSQVISFEDACDALGIDPQAMRKRLYRLKDGMSHKKLSTAVKLSVC
jgi:hypothetical protein